MRSPLPLVAATNPSRSPVPDPLPGDRLLALGQSLGHMVSARPWLLVVAALGVVVVISTGQWARRALVTWRHERFRRHAQQVVIHPPPVVEPDGAALWWANMSGLLRPASWRRVVYGATPIGLEYRWSGRQLQIVVWVPGTVPAGPVAAAVRAAWPGASTRIEDATAPLPLTRETSRAGTTGGITVATREVGAALVAALPGWYPLATKVDHGSDPLRALTAAGSDLHATEAACVQILARIPDHHRITRAQAGALALKTARMSRPFSAEGVLRGALHVVTDLLTPTHTTNRPTTSAGRAVRIGGGDLLRERDARPGLDKLTGPQWEVAIRIGVTHTTNRPTPEPGGAQQRRRRAPHEHLQGDAVARRLTTHAHALTSALAVHDARNWLRRIPLARPSIVLDARVLRAGFLLSAAELAALAGLPLDLSVAGLDRARAKAVPAPITVPSGGRNTKVLGRAQVGGHTVALPVVDAREHLHVLGSTGAGKSTLLAHLILEDIRARRATVLIDPKGDLARDVLDRLPDGAVDRLVLIDPDQPAGSATFNPLQLRRGADPDLIADNIVSIFSAIFQRAWGPRIDDVVRVSCLTLMRHRHPTLMNVAPLLNDKQFRAPFTVGFDDPAGLKGFWEWYESTPPALRAQVIGPVLARLRSFLLRDFVRATIGPYRSSFDMNTVLARGGILIARLPKGQLGEDTSRLLGSLIFASVWQAATARAHLPEERRRDASVYIDEAHNVLNLSGTVSDMLAEARGYHLSMVLAHQHLAQLPRDTQLALSANARNKIYFNCSPEDAVQLARHTRPELDDHDVSHLDAYIAATRLVIGNRETSAFTLATNPPPTAAGNLAHVRTRIAGTASPVESNPDDNDQPTQISDAPPPGAEPTAAGPPSVAAEDRFEPQPRPGPTLPHPSFRSRARIRHRAGTNPQAGGHP